MHYLQPVLNLCFNFSFYSGRRFEGDVDPLARVNQEGRHPALPAGQGGGRNCLQSYSQVQRRRRSG